jgi:hypothetical protein
MSSPSSSSKPTTLGPSSLSPALNNSIKLLSIIRLLTGAGCIFAPRFFSAQHDYYPRPDDAFAIRMIGVREGVIGGLLFTAGGGDDGNVNKRYVHLAA